MKHLVGQCLNFIEAKPVTAEIINIFGWAVVGVYVAPVLATSAVVASFAAMLLGVTREWVAPNNQVPMDVAAEALRIWWTVPSLLVYGLYAVVRPAQTPCGV